jgi:hypothetical protein
MTTSYVNGTIESECTWTPYSFCVSYPDMCVNGYPDLAAICDNIYAFPPEYFTGTNFLEVCEVNLDDACTEFPDLCTEDGSFSTDVCGMYPEKCDTTSQDYNPCASDLYACMTLALNSLIFAQRMVLSAPMFVACTRKSVIQLLMTTTLVLATSMHA